MSPERIDRTDPVYALACDQCGQGPGWACVSRAGVQVSPHRSRVAIAEGIAAKAAELTITDELEIVARRELDIATLETRDSDRLDFHEVHVARILAALRQAYQLGRSRGR